MSADPLHATQELAAPRRTRSRRTLVSVGLTVVVMGAGVTAFQSGHARPGWQDLPDPAATITAAGQTIGQAGGTGPGQVTLLSGPTRGDVTIALACSGSGTVTFTAGTKSLGGGGCFDGQPVSYSTTTPVTSLPFWVDVDAPADVDWRVSVSIA